MKKVFFAFWDVIAHSITALILIVISLSIMNAGYLKDVDIHPENLGILAIFSICIAIAVLLILTIPRITIDLCCDKVEVGYYLVNGNTNAKDLHSNWNIYPSEIEKVTIVHLTKEEKRKYTSTKFWFSKYLKIEMKHGHAKYVYVSHYSNAQIHDIIKTLDSHQ